MGLPARNHYDDEDDEQFFQESTARPKFGVIEGGGEGDGKRAGNLKSVDSDGGMAAEGDDAGDEGVSDAMQANREKTAEEEDTLDGYFKNLNSEDKRKSRGPAQKMRMSMRKRRNKVLLGLLGGLLPLVGGFITLPYQLTHLSSLLQQFHFSINEDIGESRTTRLIRYIKDPNNPEKRRLGIVGNKIANRVEAKMSRLGYDLKYSAGGFLEAVEIDLKKHPNNVADLEGSDGVRRVADTPDGKARFEFGSGEGFDRPGRKTGFKTVFRKAGYGKLAGLQSRVMIRKGGISLRPMGLLSRGTKDDLATRRRAWKDRRNERRVSGVQDQPAIRVAETDENGVPRDPADIEAERARAQEGLDAQKAAVQGETPEQRIKSTRSKLLKGGAVGGLLGIGGAGLLCTIIQLDEQADKLKWDNRALPILRMSADLIAAGDQVKSGQGFTAEEVGLWTQDLTEIATLVRGVDENTGEEVVEELGPVMNARGLRASLGLPGGAEAQSSSKYSKRNDLLKQIKESIDFIPDPVCDVATNPWFGLAVTIATLGSATLWDAGIEGAMFAAGALWIDDIVRIAAGVEVNPEAVGAALGNIAVDGARLFANGSAIAFGGRVLSGTETLINDARRDEIIAFENSQKSAWERYLSFNNPRSMVSMASMRMPQGYAASIVDVFTSPFKSAAGIFSPAYAVETYDYGFPQFGFSYGEIEDPTYENPYENMQKLEEMPGIDIDELHETIGRDCFDLDIQENPSGGVFNATSNTHYFGDDGLIMRCTKARDELNNDEAFNRYRFYLLDTSMITTLACYEGFETYCQELGFGNSGVDTEANSGGIVGDPHEPSVDIACDPRTIDVGIHDAYVGGNRIEARLCALPNITSSSGESTPGHTYYIEGADGQAIVNSRISGAWYSLIEEAAADGITMSAISSFRTHAHQQSLFNGDTTAVGTPGYSSHQAGTAIDLNNAGGGVLRSSSCPSASPPAGEDIYDWLTGNNEGNGNVDTANTDVYKWMVENASEFGLLQYSAESWHWDARSDKPSRCDFE